MMLRLLAGVLALCAIAPKQARPNVILVMADDLGYGDLGCQGHPDLLTPHLDALANDGIRFTRFHAAAPVCSPTRASCLTGRHPCRAGIHGANDGHLGADEFTLQSLLASAGYRTGHFGKWHLGTLSQTVKESNRGGSRGIAHFAPPWLRGFDTCFSTEAKVPTFDPMLDPTSGKPYGTNYWNQLGERVTDNIDGDDSRVIMDRVLPFVRESAKEQQPFFASSGCTRHTCRLSPAKKTACRTPHSTNRRNTTTAAARHWIARSGGCARPSPNSNSPTIRSCGSAATTAPRGRRTRHRDPPARCAVANAACSKVARACHPC